ncbi:hypothetical protein PR202_gb00708 [Eleusine coracana subsp. coracana]|uniref:Uncharacterized protein n=1 Tax=Eleusine coracana subsp. coracana TaxID=191504 RepID=A0AAV5DUQ4_ELECO|nr:hypothetical protein PR202_gb00708 [Eleusine coracana subsp. coracana]
MLWDSNSRALIETCCWRERLSHGVQVGCPGAGEAVTVQVLAQDMLAVAKAILLRNKHHHYSSSSSDVPNLMTKVHHIHVGLQDHAEENVVEDAVAQQQQGADRDLLPHAVRVGQLQAGEAVPVQAGEAVPMQAPEAVPVQVLAQDMLAVAKANLLRTKRCACR